MNTPLPAPGKTPAKAPAKSPAMPVDDPSPGRTDANNLPPVGDIKLSKVKGTYNTYKLELSMGQIEAIRNALEKDHADPISDELLAIFSYYVEKVPGPGEEEDDLKAREEHPGMAADEEGDFPIPMPPREGGEGMEEEPPTPDEVPPGGAPGGEAPAGGGPLPEPGMDEPMGGGGAGPDEPLPEPPAE